MFESHDNDNARERSVFVRWSLAKGLLCPGGHREIQCDDFWFRGSDFRINCGGCDLTLLVWKE
jgi:hypothetical protein